MKDIGKFLVKYVDTESLNKLYADIENKQRTNIIFDKCFIKIGKNIDQLFFNNLIKEIYIYKNNAQCTFFPKLIDYFIDDEICAIVLEKIEGNVLGTNRNDFANDSLTENDRVDIIKDIIKIKSIKIENCKLDTIYSRQEKIKKYCDKLDGILDRKDIDLLYFKCDDISYNNCSNCISHGDLIPPNIIRNLDKTVFIDWEFIAIRPESYDIAYFLMFSRVADALDVLKMTNFSLDFKKEIYKDATVLCLKEMNNWLKLKGKLDNNLVEFYIKRWYNELKIILKGF